MTDPARPQPVISAGNVGGLVSALIVSVSGLVLVVRDGITADNLTSVGTAVNAVVVALVAAVAWLLPVLQAHRAAVKVTPLASPMTADGKPLVPVDEYGKHAAAMATQSSTQSSAQSSAQMRAQQGLDYMRENYGEPVSDMAIPDAPRPQPFPRTDYEPYAQLRANAPKEDDAPVTAAGIHGHPWKKLGKRAPIPGRAAVPFGRFLTSAPAHPIADLAPDLNYPMAKNDIAGDCVVAGLLHTLQTICAALGIPWRNWSDDQILAYYRTQNPGMKTWADAGTNADGGMIIQTFLEYLVAQGVILAFGKIDHTNPDEMRAAVYLGLAIVTGETLETAQQSQAVWDYKKSGDWGGHCTCTVGYPGATRQTCVSWGAELDMTEAFIAHQLDEAWFVLTQAHVDHPAFRAGYDLPGFAAAVAELTNGKVVVPAPVGPSPSPAPAPVPTPVPTPGPVVVPIPASWVTWARHVLTLKSESHATQAVAREIIAAAGG